VQHCDLKPDNFAVKASTITGGTEIEASDIMLLDFGSAITLPSDDDNLLTKLRFTGFPSRSDMKCPTMQQNLPWSPFEADYFGLCYTAHFLLFSDDIKIDHVKDNQSTTGQRRWCPCRKLTRLKNADLWEVFFDSLMNFDQCARVITATTSIVPTLLKELREKFEHVIQPQLHDVKWELRKQANDLIANKKRVQALF
jgi:hypothetical protein